jgi:hypothetical protein
METTSAKTSAKDFFLWLGALISLYTAATSLIALLFDYINFAYPDVLASYADPYAGSVRIEMSLLIVAMPTALLLFRLIRNSLEADPGKASIWIRKWGLMLTLFIASVVALVDLVTLINTFLGGEISMRFILKVAVVLLIAVGVFLHFLADLKGYWLHDKRKSLYIGIGAGVVVLASIVSGFFIIGTPAHFREIRLDTQRTNDLQSIQYQVLNRFQTKRTVPATLAELNDDLTGFTVPVDPQTQAPYTYEMLSKTSFKVCATFSAATEDLSGRGATDMGTSYPVASPGGYGFKGTSDVWTHQAGNTCFTRTIDPQLYPAPMPGVKGL